MKDKKNAAIFTLGCRLNQADAALMAGRLRDRGWEIVEWEHGADLMIVNSCAVTGAAAQKTRQCLRATRRRWPRAYIVLAGCMPDAETETAAPPPACDLVVPNALKPRLAELLPPELRPDQAAADTGLADSKAGGEPGLFREAATGHYPGHTRAQLKIQEGCDFFCSYCIVPFTRGRPRSRERADIMREAGELLANGHRELVLAGVNVATYDDHGCRLADLVAELLRLPGDFRLRLSSTEPGPECRRLISLMAAEPRLCRFLHLPLQYGEDTILRRMNRRYTVAEFADLAAFAARRVPGICLGSDVMVGFPGETDAVFAACREAVAGLPLAYLHVFTYSPRPGTRAEGFPDRVESAVAAARHRQLAGLGRRQAKAFAVAAVGAPLRILVEEHNAAGRAEGWSDNYLRVELDTAEAPGLNTFADVQVLAATGPRRVLARPAQAKPPE